MRSNSATSNTAASTPCKTEAPNAGKPPLANSGPPQASVMQATTL